MSAALRPVPDRADVRTVLDAFDRVAPPILRARLSDDSCLNATRVVIETMRTFRVKARPLAVEAFILNPAFHRLATTLNRFPATIAEREQWFHDHGAHSVGLGIVGSTPTKAASFGEGWNGHLVAIVDGARGGQGDVLVDASARQMARPQHDIAVPDVLLVHGLTPAFWAGQWQAIELAGGSLVSYRPTIGRLDYRPLPGFQYHDGNRAVATEIVAAMRAYLGDS